MHAYDVLGLRHHEGWIGYGTHIHKASFRRLISPGEEIEATCTARRLRLGDQRHIVRYTFEFWSGDGRCYLGDQSAIWMRTSDG